MKWLSGFAFCLLVAAATFGQAGDFAPQQTASNPLQIRVADGSIGGGVLGTFQFKATNIILTPSATNFIYLDLSQSPPVLAVNTTGFPTSQAYQIATAVTNTTQITSLTDSRPSFNLLMPAATATNTGVTNNFTVPQKFSADISCFKGPNPYVDIRCFNVRAINPNAAPAISGVNCTTTAGLPTITLSSISTFQNNDGIVCQNAGAANGLGAMGTPTVTPFDSAVGTQTGSGVAAPAGATTYNYVVFACDQGGGCTAPSAAGSTTTGASSLGAQSITGVTATRSNDTWTYTIGSAPPFSVGTVVFVANPTVGISDADFEGYFTVSTVTGTGLTVAGAPLDTRNGARTASTGSYTVHYFNYNKVTWPAVTGSPYRYFVCSDRASPGTYHLLGPARLPQNPTNSNDTEGSLEFDDFGATMMAASTGVVPWYLSDANCTGSATNDNWVTTIASGAGTTTITASGNAPNSNGGPKTIRFDTTPNAATAATAAGNAPLAFPFSSAGTAYVFNSVWDNSSLNTTLLLPQGLQLNDTLITGGGGAGGGQWYGNRLPGAGTIAQFSPKGTPTVTTTVSPGVLIAHGLAMYMEGLRITAPDNGIAILQDEGSSALGSTYVDSQFTTNSSSSDYMGIAFVCRGGASVGSDCLATFRGKTLIFSGTQSMAGNSFTPSFFCDSCGRAQFDFLMGSARPLILFGASNGGGGSILINFVDWQGGSAPLISFGPHAVNGGGTYSATVGGVLDTMAQPCVAMLAPNGIASANLGSGGSCIPSSNFPQFTGVRFANGIIGGASNVGQNRDTTIAQSGILSDGIFGNTQSQQAFASSIRQGPNNSIFISDTAPVLNTCPVSAGGSISIGPNPWAIVPVWWDGSEGTYSNNCTATTSSGNQTVTLNWNAIPGNPKQINIYVGGAKITQTAAGNATSAVISSVTVTGRSQSTLFPAGGPTMLMPGTQGISSGGPITVVTSTFANLGTVPAAGIFKYCTDCTTAATCAGAGSGHMAVSNGTNWTCQ